MSFCTVEQIGDATIDDVQATESIILSRVPDGLYSFGETRIVDQPSCVLEGNQLWINAGFPIAAVTSIDVLDRSKHTLSILATINTPSIEVLPTNRKVFGVPAYMKGGQSILNNDTQLRIHCDAGWSSVTTRASGQEIKAGESYFTDSGRVLNQSDRVLTEDAEVLVPHPALNKLGISVGRRMLELYRPSKRGNPVDLFAGWEEFLRWLT